MINFKHKKTKQSKLLSLTEPELFEAGNRFKSSSKQTPLICLFKNELS